MKSFGRLWNICAAVVCAAVTANADIPALTTYDLPNPQILEAPIEHHVESWINLYNKSLLGFSYGMGPVTVMYDESYPSTGNAYLGNLLGNFDLLDYTFSAGRVVNFPVISNDILKLGAARYQLSDFYSAQGGGSFRMLEKSGTFVIREMTGGSFGEVFEVLDTVNGISYGLAEATGFPGVYRAVSARYADGLSVQFLWNDTLFNGLRYTPQRVRLMRDAVELERSDFAWNTSGGVPRISSIRSWIGGVEALWMRVDFGYQNVPRLPNYLLSSVRVGVGSGGTVTGIQLQHGSIALGKDILTGISNHQGKQLFTFLTESGPFGPGGAIRSVYSGFRAGSATVQPISIDYQTHEPYEDRWVAITNPRAPQDPMSVRLHATTGALLEQRTASCPHPRYVVNLIPSGALQGMIESEVIRTRCDKPLTRTYTYTEDGVVSYIEEQANNWLGQPETQLVQYQFATIVQPNGVKRLLDQYVASAEGVGVEKTFTPEGRPETIRSLADGLLTSFAYTYWDDAHSRVRSVTISYPNGRADRAEYDPNGFLQQSFVAWGDPQFEARTTVGYDTFRRPSLFTDERGSTKQLEYYPDGRLYRSIIESADESSVVSTELTYDSSFPDQVRRATTRQTESGSTVQAYSEQIFDSNLPLLRSVDRVSGSTAVRALELEYDPATLRVTRDCILKAPGSNDGCNSFNYHGAGSGILQGFLNYISVGAAPSQGGYTETQVYSAFGEVVGMTTADNVGSQTELSAYDGFGRLSQVITNPGQGQLERQAEILHNIHGKVDRQRTWTGGVLTSDISLVYDAAGKGPRPISMYDAVGNTELQISFEDPALRPTAMRQFVRGALESSIEVDSWQYDPLDRPGYISSFVDGVGASTGEQHFDSNGDLIQETDILGQTSYFEYDGFGRPVQIDTPETITNFDYRVNAGKLEVVRTSAFETNNPQLRFPRATVATFDPLGRLTKFSDLTVGDIAELFYNTRGLNDRLEFSHSDHGALDRWEFSFDPRGRQTERSLNGALVDRAVFAGRGMLLSSADSRGISTTFTYDGLTRLIRTDLPDSSMVEVQSFTFYYPLQGNGANRRVVLRDRGNATVTAYYNPTSDLVSSSASGGSYGNSSVTFSYEGSRITDVSRQDRDSWSSVHYDFDAYGRPSHEVHSVLSGVVTYELWREYSALGAITAHIYPDPGSSLVEYQRDNFGRIQNVWFNGYPVANFTFDGPVLTSITLGDVTRTLSYENPKGLLSGVIDQRGVQTLLDLSLVYDGRERISTRTDRGPRRGALAEVYENFSYSTVNLLGSYTYAMPYFGSGTLPYQTTIDGVLNGLGIVANSVFELPSRFSYDAYGNPLSESGGNGRTFSWNRAAPRLLNDPARGLEAFFFADALGRSAFTQKERAYYEQDKTEVRDAGMVLYQSEVTR